MLPSMTGLDLSNTIAAAYPFRGGSYTACSPNVYGSPYAAATPTPTPDIPYTCQFTDAALIGPPGTNPLQPNVGLSLYGGLNPSGVAIPIAPATPTPTPISSMEIPPQPNISTTSGGGESPLLPGMSNNRPTATDRALWFRGVGGDTNFIGESGTVNYGSDRSLYFYNHSWPVIGTGPTTLNSPGRLVLPDTVCIDTSDGSVDDRCTKQTTTPSTTLADLNQPFNPHYPSNASSGIYATSTDNRPASTYALCGLSNSSGKYQSVQSQPDSVFNITSSTSGCPVNTGNGGNPRAAIVTFSGTTGRGIRNVSLDPTNAAFRGQGSGASLPPVISGGALATTSSAMTIEARNTYAVNKVQVINLTGLGSGTSYNTACPIVATPPTNTLLGTLTLQANSAEPAPSPVFILRACSNQDLLLNALKIKLNGVDPNNVFWSVPRINSAAASTTPRTALTIRGTAVAPSVIVGNFIGNMTPTAGGTATNTTTLNISSNVALRSTRFLGFRAFRGDVPGTVTANGGAIGIDPTVLVGAMTTVNQPIVLPVMQFQSPDRASVSGSEVTLLSLQPVDSTTGLVISGAINGNPTASNTGKWTQQASTSAINSYEVNVYFVAGNTPSRSRVDYQPASGAALVVTGETGGGLNNFVRFLENWTGAAVKITGGFIQNTRSVYATASFSNTAPYTSPTALNTSSDIQTLFINPANTGHSLSNFRKYYMSATIQAIPYYAPPLRLWGFDVGLLTQSADRFAERFSSSVANPNEFFREADRTDPYVKALLCAAQPAIPTTLNPGASPVNPGLAQRLGTIPTNYTSYVLGSAFGSNPANSCAPLTYN